MPGTAQTHLGVGVMASEVPGQVVALGAGCRQFGIGNGHRLLCVKCCLDFCPYRLNGGSALPNHVLAADFTDQQAAESVLGIVADVYLDSFKIRHVLHQGNELAMLWREGPRQTVGAARYSARFRRWIKARRFQRKSRELIIDVQLAFSCLTVGPIQMPAYFQIHENPPVMCGSPPRYPKAGPIFD